MNPYSIDSKPPEGYDYNNNPFLEDINRKMALFEKSLLEKDQRISIATQIAQAVSDRNILLTSQYSTLSSQYDSLFAKYDDLSSKHQNLATSHDDLNAKYEVVLISKAKLEQRNEELTLQYEKMQETIIEMQKSLEKSEKEHKSAKEEASSLKLERDKFKSMNDDKQSENASLKAMNDTLKSEMANLKKEGKIKIGKYEASVKKRDEKIAADKALIEKLKKEIIELTEGKAAADDECIDLQKELKAKDSSHDLAIRGREYTISSLEKEKITLAEENETLKGEKETLKGEKATLKKKNRNLEKEKKASGEKIENLNKQLLKLETKKGPEKSTEIESVFKEILEVDFQDPQAIRRWIVKLAEKTNLSEADQLLIEEEIELNAATFQEQIEKWKKEPSLFSMKNFGIFLSGVTVGTAATIYLQKKSSSCYRNTF